ncbi:alpha/beta-hydrolase [Microthyrium microscopicum]|uniref:Alpha/beta-hydrolase n=1 Tax=Microthyrium microscopicum TaxID=703497 RepID=A0A6A6TYY4_9PEZI|nr:alpha/beta-hydrolase [Microthyrium microscopicum]
MPQGKGKGGGPIVSPYQKDTSGGSGPYKAHYTTDPGLPDHTIYAPKEAPKDVSMPLIVWGEGACAAQGTAFVNLLTELASHGYVVLANGAPGTPGSAFPSDRSKTTSPEQLTQSMDWVTSGKDAGKYGTIDKTKVAAAGQSCGGAQAMRVSGDPRIKLTAMFNSGGMGKLGGGKGPAFAAKDLKHPIIYLLGGTGDLAYAGGSAEYKSLPATVPSILFSMDGAGHGGTYGEIHAGKFGKAAVAAFDYILKGDAKAKSSLFPGEGFKADGWDYEFKNWDNFKPS